jgi:hypothetical protein
MQTLVVRVGAREWIAPDRGGEFGFAEDQHGRLAPEVARHQPRNPACVRPAIAAGAPEQDVPALDVGSNSCETPGLERARQRLHGHFVLAHDIDSTQQSKPGRPVSHCSLCPYSGKNHERCRSACAPFVLGVKYRQFRR